MTRAAGQVAPAPAGAAAPPQAVPRDPAAPPNPTSSAALTARWDAAVMGTYGTPPVALVRGQGARVVDADGREYLDLVAGIAVTSLGHGHPAVLGAVTWQLATLGHVSNLAITEPVVELAERLLGIADLPGGRVLFANSGAEANEAALKLVRRHHPDRREVVAATGSFHGRTLGALAVTGQPAKRAPFEPLPGPVTFVPYGDAAALTAAVTERTAAVILEPVLGEGGVVPAPAGYLEAARAACTATGALLVLDEVQGGIGRTGAWLARDRIAPGVRPDVVTLAKGLGGGLPIGACLAAPAVAGALRKGDHGSTFGGNPVCCAAALAVLDVVAGLLESVRAVGDRLATGVRAAGGSAVREVRGVGLWLGIVLAEPRAAEVEQAARSAGFLVNAVAPDVLRLAPPLVLTEAEADEFLAALPELLRQARPAAQPAPAVQPVLRPAPRVEA